MTAAASLTCRRCSGAWSPTALAVQHLPGCRRFAPDKRQQSPARGLIAELAGLDTHRVRPALARLAAAPGGPA